LACALACAGSPAVARGADVSAAELRALAAAAQRDPAALRRLRDVDAVDGRPAAVGAALRGDDADVRARLRALAQPATGSASPPASAPAARAQARDVLDQRRFKATSVPSPLRSVRERVGAALRWLGRPLADAFDWVASWLPGGRSLLWALLAAVVLGSTAALAARAGARRAAGRGAVAGDGVPGGERLSAARLRQEAENAERRGDLDGALRLRFRAGLVELDSRELVELRPALTNHELLRAVPSPTLAELVDGFEAVAYGGRPADPDDLRSARDGWPRVPGEAGAR
ncbi:MAG: hypothetical protein QOJ35_2750, partial [Solirubrobacteraceae bacterium]|nr:hypothetical protein [Solirubrobacteraceae bacterium]